MLRYKYFSYILKEQLFTTPGFFPLLLGYALLLALAFLCVRSLKNSRLIYQLLCVFTIAALPRLTLYLMLPYVESGDYAYFASLGRTFLAGDYAALAERFGTLPDFMGLSMLYSIPMRFFGDSTAALRLCNCILSSVSCVLVFLIGRRYHPCVGLSSAWIYAFYPGSLLAAETVGNPVSSLSFLLLAVYLLMIAASSQSRIGLFHALLSGCSLLLSQYLHPSSTVTVIASILFLLPLVIDSVRRRKTLLRVVCVYLCFFVGFVGLRGIWNVYFDAIGLRSDATGKQSSYYIDKLVMGLNPETNGNYNVEDIVWCSQQPESTRMQAAFKRIQARLPNARAVLDMIDTKIVCTWMVQDTNYGAFFSGLSDWVTEAEKSSVPAGTLEQIKQARSRFAASFILLDFFYVAAIYVFALLGILLRKPAQRESDLLIWIFLGFAGAFILFESQSRYRYPAMPVLCMLAGIGVYELATRLRKSNVMAGVGCTPSFEQKNHSETELNQI